MPLKIKIYDDNQVIYKAVGDIDFIVKDFENNLKKKFKGIRNNG
jgi:hypothetical protein